MGVTELNLAESISFGCQAGTDNINSTTPGPKPTTMPPAEEESHPPPNVPNDSEDAEAEDFESDEYEIEVGGDG